MAEDTSNQLRFSIEESVWLDQGQEVDEILSMSLEPDISVVENKHYVSVRGSLTLAGEYKPMKADEQTQKDFVHEDEAGIRPVEDVSVSEDGVAYITHHFPVDITIPLSRIQRLEDIYVTVDSFDYTLPQNNCLRLEADVSISGMMDYEPEQSVDQEYEDESEPQPQQEVLDEVKADDTQGEEFTDTEHDNAWPSKVDESPEEEDHTGEEDIYDPFHYEAEHKPTQTEEGEDTSEAGITRTGQGGPTVEMKSRMKDEEPATISDDVIEGPDDIEEEASEAAETEPDIENDEAQEEQPREENTLYLTKMMTHEEEAFSRLKMCIIQPGDSLDKIAERYQLPLSQLVRVNHLESEELEEGEILYIPVSV